MVWVRTEYAGELAVLLSWLSVLLPWNLQFSGGVAGGSLLFVRFPFFQVRFAFGVAFAEALVIQDPISAMRFQAGQSIEVAYQVWTVGAAVLGVVLLVSVLYYLRQDALDSGPADPVRVLGALIGVAAVVLAASNYLLWDRGFPGVPIPVGVGFMLVFSGLLLVVDRKP